MKVTGIRQPQLAEGRPLLSLQDVRPGRKVLAITGSTKTKNWEIRSGKVVEIREEVVGLTGAFVFLSAVVKLDSGELVITHRLKSPHGA